MKPTDSEILTALRNAVVRGGNAIRRIDRGEVSHTAKGNRGDYVTEADHAAEAAIMRSLKQSNLGIPLVSEEQPFEKQSPQTCFITDPLDGTIIWSRGSKDWGTLGAYVSRGVPQMGVIYQPERGVLVTSSPKAGCLVTTGRGAPKRIRLKGHEVPERLAIEYVVAYATPLSETSKVYEELLKKNRVLVNIAGGSAVAAQINVLLGITDAFLQTSGMVWDIAAGIAAVRTAGGYAETIETKAFEVRPGNTPVLYARNREIGNFLMPIVRQAMGFKR